MIVTNNIQHGPKLASANQANLNRLAAGLALSELCRKTGHDWLSLHNDGLQALEL